MSAAATALESAYNDSRSHDKDELAAMRLRRAEMLFIISQLAAYVQQASGGDEEKILSSGFDVMGAKTPHPDVADQVFNVKLNDGSTSGKVKISFDKAKYAVIYGIQVSEKIDATDWNIAGFTTRTQKEIGNLNPGTKYWIRVAGIGREEVGHPSEPISIIAR